MSALTPYDTGDILEPKLHARPYGGGVWFSNTGEIAMAADYGKVDFDDVEGATHCTIFAHPSTVDSSTTLVQIDTVSGDRFKIMLNDGELYNGNPDADQGQRDEVARLAKVAFDAAEGDSNDDEIQALQEALSEALSALGIEVER